MMPSLLLTLLFGLTSFAVVPGYHGAPWAWGKLITTVLMLGGSLLGIRSPIKREAELASAALTDISLLGGLGAQTRCGTRVPHDHWPGGNRQCRAGYLAAKISSSI